MDADAVLLDYKPKNLPGCCLSTVRLHIRHNPMMVCDQCRMVIKGFLDESAFMNYLKFCHSRGRCVVTGSFENYFILSFKGYD